MFNIVNFNYCVSGNQRPRSLRRPTAAGSGSSSGPAASNSRSSSSSRAQPRRSGARAERTTHVPHAHGTARVVSNVNDGHVCVVCVIVRAWRAMTRPEGCIVYRYQSAHALCESVGPGAGPKRVHDDLYRMHRIAESPTLSSVPRDFPTSLSCLVPIWQYLHRPAGRPRKIAINYALRESAVRPGDGAW